MTIRGTARVALAVCLLGTVGCNQPPAATSAADVIAPLDAAGLAALVEQHRGRVVLVNLWATWCSPCLKEIPELIRLQAEHDPEDLLVMGISLDTDQPEAQVRAFRDEHFPGFFTYLAAETEWDVLVTVIDPAWDEVLPTSFVIDRNGELATIIMGGKPYEAFAGAIAPLL